MEERKKVLTIVIGGIMTFIIVSVVFCLFLEEAWLVRAILSSIVYMLGNYAGYRMKKFETFTVVKTIVAIFFIVAFITGIVMEMSQWRSCSILTAVVYFIGIITVY